MIEEIDQVDLETRKSNLTAIQEGSNESSVIEPEEDIFSKNWIKIIKS